MDTSMIEIVNRHSDEYARNRRAANYSRKAYKAKLARLMHSYGYESFGDVVDAFFVWVIYTGILVLVALMGCHVVGWI